MKNFLKTNFDTGRYALKRGGGWLKRAFFRRDSLSGEQVETPARLVKQAFFSKKTACAALALITALFLFVFIAPIFVPMDVNYTDPLQQNASPVLSLRKVPKALKDNIEKIDGFAGFTAGLSKDGELFVWGNTKDKLQKIDMKAFPQELKAEKTAFLAAGKDHILAITQNGYLVGWGDKSCGQYGFEPVLNAISTPDELQNGIAPERVKALVCGYQTSAIVTIEGKLYAWGNINAVKNLPDMNGRENIETVAFTNSSAVALTKDGKVFTGAQTPFTSLVSSETGVQRDFSVYLADKKAVLMATSNKCVAIVLDNGETVVSGVFENGEENLPILQTGEYFVSLDGGTRHFVGVTNFGNAYAWGHNAYGQCNLQADGNARRAFAGSAQSYIVDGDGTLIQSAGLKGHIMGTDGRGRDVFTRIVHGGKMTLTIGAVAVLVSSVIAVIVGCVSGYFGGTVDTLLMRLTEIFASIPFLPFAMLLSQIIKHYNISETARIFIIMLILGALSWPSLARMIRGQVLAEREKEFVTAAKALGVKEKTIAFRHILPNIVSVILVSMTLDFAGCLLTESSLSYLGFGVQQPQPTWGNMLNGCNNSTVIQHYWWQWLFPALFLSLATICINIIGDALRDALDPKGKR